MTVAVQQAGVDTWSPCWYVQPDTTAASKLRELATIPTARARLIPEPIGGHRVGYSEVTGMLFAEGHPGGDRLALPDELPVALDVLEQQLHQAGVPVPPGRSYDLMGTIDTGTAAHTFPTADARRRAFVIAAERAAKEGKRTAGFAGVRRVDATVDLLTDSTPEGLAVLAGVAAVARDAPRSKAEVIFASDGTGVETVYMRGMSGKKVLARWYDKGREGGMAARGRLLRPEDQRRYTKGSRRDVTELTSEYVRGKFHQRFVPLWQAAKGVTVAGPIVLAEKLVAAIEAGEISPAAAERLAGHLLLQAAAGGTVGGPSAARAQHVSSATRTRRRRAARELGLVLADGVLQEVEVNLHQVLEQALDAGAWTGGQG